MAKYKATGELSPMRFATISGEDYIKFQDLLQWLKNQQKRLNQEPENELLQLVIRELVAANNGKGRK